MRNLKPSQLWPQPGVVSSVVRAIQIPNLSTEPRTLKRHEHFCQVTPVFEPKEESPTSQSPTQRPLPPSHASHSASVHVDPGRILPEAVRANFQSLLSEYDSVFDPHFPGYNGSTGPYQAKVNMGPVEPPQWNGRLPQYARDKLVELQEKFDHLEQLGVFQRPEDFTLGIRGFSRVRREFSVLGEGRHILGRRPKPRAAKPREKPLTRSGAFYRPR